MVMADRLTFHVLFVPGSVKCLRIFTPSLAVWGGGSHFRLVSNGCSPAEDELLMQLAQLSDCFEFYRLPGDGMWEHGAALLHLQQLETRRHFAILDSDIFATGAFLHDLFLQAGQVDALFSCLPIWSYGQSTTIPNSFKIANCPFVQMEDGFCLGGTYFAIYDNIVLSDCLATYGIHLGRYLWEDIPAEIRDRLRSERRQMSWYDPLKLVNILLTLDGYNCRFLDTQYLHHVGGVSNAALSQRTQSSNLLRRCCSALIPDLVRQIGTWAGISNTWPARLSWNELRYISAKCNRRNAVSAFIYQLLHELDNGEKRRGRFALGDPELDSQMLLVETLIRSLYPTWASWLNGSQPINLAGAEMARPDVGNAAAA